MKKIIVAFALSMSCSLTIAQISFSPFQQTTYGTFANSARDLASGDLNGDGKLDMVMADFSAGNVVVVLGAGNGTFSGIQTFPIIVGFTSQPVGLELGDFNKDGKLDVAVTTRRAQRLSIMLGDGTGMLGTPTHYFIDWATGVTVFGRGSIIADVVSGDFNGDSNIDLVVTDEFFQLGQIFIGTGSGTFTPGVRFSTGNANYTAITADFNNDGKLDIAVAESAIIGTGAISLFTGRGDGTFNARATFPTSNKLYTSSLAAADFNGDGNIDIAATNSGAYILGQVGDVSILLGNGAGSFGSATNYTTGIYPSDVIPVDVNLDGNIDLVVHHDGYDPGVGTAAGTGNISILEGNGTGTFVDSYSMQGIGSSLVDRVISGDFNNDGRPDVASAGYSNTLIINLNASPCVSAPPTPVISSFTPTIGTPGTTVIINGSNFSTTPFNNNVKFNGATAPIIASSATSITTRVPVSATDGAISIIIGCNIVTSSSNFIVAPPGPDITSFTPTSGPIGTTVTITGTNFDPTPVNNTVKFNGVDAATPSTSSATSLTVVVPASATIGPISVTTLDGTGTSSSNFVVTCTPPTPPSSSNISRCGSGTVLLAASGATGTQEYRWYDVASGGTSLGSLATFTSPSLTITTSYYVSIFDVPTSCESDRTLVDAIVNTPPAAPIDINNSGCSGTSISVSATGGSAGQYRWYTTATGGTHDAAQTNDTFSTPTLTVTTSFFVAINDGSCESTRTEVIATVIPLPTAPGFQSVNPVCPGSNVTLTATGGIDGQYRWYDGATLITGEVNGTYLFTNLSLTKTFQVSIDDGTCESNKTSVTITVQNCTPPIVASTTATAFIEGLITIDLEGLVTDDEDNVDPSRLQITMQPISGAPASLNGFELTINYTGFPFTGSDRVGIEACDLTDLCTEQEIAIELSGDIAVYNALSPNGDGKNEVFTIQYIDILPETQSNKVSIYNRWGDEVFSIHDYNNNDRVFKGESNNGKKLSPGTYFYKIAFADGKKTLTGFIALKY